MAYTITCPACRRTVEKPHRTTRFCSIRCRDTVPVSAETRAKMSAASKGKPKSAETRARMSAAWKGKPKPWAQGERNVNFGNAAQNRVREKFMASLEPRRGLPSGTPESRKRHSERMLGPANKMRGRRHTDETRARVSAAKRAQYSAGLVRTQNYKLSAPEKAMVALLRGDGHRIRQQFHIKGVPFLYDALLEDVGIIVEFQGDYWHANPQRYPAHFMIGREKGGYRSAQAIWARDATKAAAATRSGYRVVFVWESDCKRLGLRRAVYDALGCFWKAVA